MTQFYVKRIPYGSANHTFLHLLYFRRPERLNAAGTASTKNSAGAGFNNYWMRTALTLFLALSLQIYGAAALAAFDFTNSTPDGPSSPLPSDQPLQCENNPNSCPIGGSDVGSSLGGLQPRSTVGNPIDLMSGNKFQSETDFSLPNSQLMLRRMYNSASADSNVGLGMGWRHSFSVSIVDAGDGNREVVQSDGTRLRFSPNGSNEDGNTLLYAVQGMRGYLVQQENRHQWHLPDGRVLSFLGTFLIQIDWPDQRSLKLYYRAKRLESVTDETGRVMLFSYTPWPESGLNEYTESRFSNVPGHLEKITLPDGSNIHYKFDNKIIYRRFDFRITVIANTIMRMKSIRVI